MTPTLRAEGMSVTSPPFKTTISPNQDPYELSTPKHWCIMHHIHGSNKELLHEFLGYKRNTWLMKCSSWKHSGSKTKILALDDTRACIGPMMQNPRLLLMGRAPKSPPSPQARHWATPICHSSQRGHKQPTPNMQGRNRRSSMLCQTRTTSGSLPFKF
jgi:hypothetical protein